MRLEKRNSKSFLIKKLRFTHHEFIAYTVSAIASSPFVWEYVIGYTSRQSLLRKREYKSRGYNHLVILADKLTLSEAHWLEEVLQGFISECKDYPEYKKYDPERRGKRYYPSAGQRTAKADEPVHSIYMAWAGSDPAS